MRRAEEEKRKETKIDFDDQCILSLCKSAAAARRGSLSLSLPLSLSLSLYLSTSLPLFLPLPPTLSPSLSPSLSVMREGEGERRVRTACAAGRPLMRIPYHNKADGFTAALVLALNQVRGEGGREGGRERDRGRGQLTASLSQSVTHEAF